MDSGLTAAEPARDSLNVDNSQVVWKWDLDLSWIPELVFLNHILYGGIHCPGMLLVLPQLGMPDIVDTPREAFSTLRSGWEVGKVEGSNLPYVI